MKESLNTTPPHTSASNVGDSAVARRAEDHALVERCLAGEQAAFEMLVKRYERKLYSVAFGFVRNREDALDRVQEAFVKAYRNLGGFQKTASFYTWLYRIAVNVCIDYIRREKKRKYDVDYDDARSHGGSQAGSGRISGTLAGSNPAASLKNKELGEKLVEAMMKLSDAHREILTLREIDGLSYEELSEALGVPRGTVMSRLHHARSNLKKQLTKYVSE